MDIETFSEFCLSLSHSSQDLKWDEVLCFCVCDKIFAVYNLEVKNICFKISPDDFDLLMERDGFSQAAHFKKKQWIAMQDLNCASDDEIQQWILKSYHLVVSKLPKKLQTEVLSQNL